MPHTKRLRTLRPPAASPPDKPAEAPKPASGRVVHDAHGNAVWDWIKQTGHAALESTSLLLKRLELPDLELEDSSDQSERLDDERLTGGGYDPYGKPAKPVTKVTKK
jgi:hypothetical protein